MSKFTSLMIALTALAVPANAQDATPTAPTKPAPHSRAEYLARKYPPLPEGVTRKHVTVWSDGTRMAADIYLPKGLKKDQRVPVIVFANGTGGTKKKLPTKVAPYFVARGYAFVAFDYRGWGESDSKLMMTEPMPEPDASGEVTVKARALRWQMDYPDQTTDIQNVISYISREPNIDPARIGLFGTSFGGGLVTWVAAHDPRVMCLVAQVPGMAGGHDAAARGRRYDAAAKQARGEIEPIPFKTGGPDPKSRYAHMRYNRAKWAAYNVVGSSHKITVPTLFIDAEKDELMDISKNAGAVVQILKKKGVIVKHVIIPKIGHYGVYNVKQKEATQMSLDWFDKHLKAKPAKTK